MNLPTRRASWWRLAVIAGLLSFGLLAPSPSVAQTGAPSCAAGYALWAAGQGRSDMLMLSGSNTTVAGAVRSNADLRISGSNNSISGAVEYATSFEDGGDSNSYPTPARTAASAPPVAYAIADYRPGGSIAAAAQAAGRYTQISGDFDVSEPRVLSGLYYVTGEAKLGGSTISGSFTIVAEGAIDVSGSQLRATPYAGGLLLFSNKAEVGAAVIKLAGSDSDLRGVIYGPGGTVELSGSNSSYRGMILGDALKLSGSNLRLAFAGEYCPGQPPPPAEAPEPYAPDEVIVKLFSAGDLAAVAQANGLNPAPRDQFGARPIFRLGIADGSDPLAKAEQLKPASGSGGDSRVEYAEPNYLAQTPEGRKGRGSWVIGESAGGYGAQWAPATIRLAEAHGVTRGAGVTVAVLDTGVDPAHPALAGRLVAGFDFVDFDSDPREQGVYGTDDGFGHGTHVAGLVALAAPEAQIMPVRVLEPDGAGNIWVLSEGLLFAAEGPDGLPGSGDEADLINLSLGTLRRTQLLEDLVAEITCGDDDDDDCDDNGGSGGVAVISAAGNGGDSTPQYPAAERVAGALAVGASSSADALADFSTYGPWVRLAAPGAEVVSAVPGGEYGTWSGTSMAAPLTAGVAALLLAAEPGLDPAALVARLVASGRAICGPVAARLDAAAALGATPAAPASCAADHTVYLTKLRGNG